MKGSKAVQGQGKAVQRQWNAKERQTCSGRESISSYRTSISAASAGAAAEVTSEMVARRLCGPVAALSDFFRDQKRSFFFFGSVLVDGDADCATAGGAWGSREIGCTGLPSRSSLTSTTGLPNRSNFTSGIGLPSRSSLTSTTGLPSRSSRTCISEGRKALFYNEKARLSLCCCCGMPNLHQPTACNPIMQAAPLSVRPLPAVRCPNCRTARCHPNCAWSGAQTWDTG